VVIRFVFRLTMFCVHMFTDKFGLIIKTTKIKFKMITIKSRTKINEILLSDLNCVLAYDYVV